MKLLLSLITLALLAMWLWSIADSRVIQLPEPRRMIKLPKVEHIITEQFYFTNYNYVESQTDKSPCYGALSKANLCVLSQDNYTYPMAITKDIREKYGIKPRDRIELVGDEWCKGTYTVLDEMWPRFRKQCIKRNGVCIKWDIANKKGWKCHIKLKK